MDLMGENHLRDTTEGAITSVVGGSSTNGGVKKGDMSESTSTFTHQPLDHTKESIRILTINPDLSNDSLVQCTMRNSTADDQYICLSYVWGPEDVSHSILIDGRLFAIRKNLLDFLLVARTKYKNKGLWIDGKFYSLNISLRYHTLHTNPTRSSVHRPEQYYRTKPPSTANGPDIFKSSEGDSLVRYR